MLAKDEAYLVVRAVVTREADRSAFDHWYATDHMPKALVWLTAKEGRRYWSVIDPSVHYAIYRCPAERLKTWQSLQDSSAIEERGFLKGEFDAAWPNVARTRDVLECVDTISPR